MNQTPRFDPDDDDGNDGEGVIRIIAIAFFIVILVGAGMVIFGVLS